MKARLASGGEAWFVRRKQGRFCGLTPVSRAGRRFTALYFAWIAMISLLLVEREDDIAFIVVGVAVILASTLLYAVTALRMSAQAPSTDKRGC